MRRRYLTLVAVCTGWGTIPLLARQIDLAAPAIVFVRVWVAALALGLVLLLGGRRQARSTAAGADVESPRVFRYAPGRCVIAGLLLAVHWTAMFAGYRRAPADTVAFVVFLAPVGVAALAPRLLGERVRRRTIVALAVAVGGLALIAGPSLGGTSAGGLAYAALSAATFVGLILVSKPLSAVYGGLRLTFIEMTVAGVALLPAALTAIWATADVKGWASLMLLGTVHTGLGITLYLRALAEVPATHVGILGYLEPVSIVLLSWLFLAEPPALSTLLGGALVVTAGALVVFADDAGSAFGVRPSTGPLPTPEVPARVVG